MRLKRAALLAQLQGAPLEESPVPSARALPLSHVRKRSATTPLRRRRRRVEVVLRGDGGERGVGRGGVVGRPPVVRQQLREVALLQRGQTLEYILEIGPGIVPVEFG